MAHLLRFLLAAALSPFAFAATVYSDGTFDPSDWTVTFPFSHSETSLTLSQASPDGNPYFLASYLVSERSAPSPTLTTISAAFQNSFVWDPQTDGALTNLDFSLDFRNISTSFPTNPRGLSWAPALLQNGTLYINSPGFVQPLNSPSFQNRVWNLTPASTFMRWAGPTANLNLSETGQPITFGFAVGLLSGCGGLGVVTCPETVIYDAMDNFSVSLEGVAPGNEIPEPSTFALAALGLFLLRPSSITFWFN